MDVLTGLRLFVFTINGDSLYYKIQTTLLSTFIKFPFLLTFTRQKVQ